jgi:hypothetical protein
MDVPSFSAQSRAAFIGLRSMVEFQRQWSIREKQTADAQHQITEQIHSGVGLLQVGPEMY